MAERAGQNLPADGSIPLTAITICGQAEASSPPYSYGESAQNVSTGPAACRGCLSGQTAILIRHLNSLNWHCPSDR
jgi:hypothetical protein